ncbi:MAG: DUF4405 domain-containing protein [Spirosomataceae bacterium]
MKNKNLISLTIGLSFLTIAVTGLLLYFKQKSHAVEITHTVIGLVFIGFAIFHIKNNWSSIKGYTSERRTGKIQKEFIWASIIAVVVVVGGLTEVLEPVAEVGRIFAKGGKGGRPPFGISLAEIETNNTSSGKSLQLVLVKNKIGEESDIAVWVEDTNSHYVESLLVSPKFSPANDIKVNAERPVPPGSFILNTHTSASLPFVIKLAIKKGDKTELYQSNVRTLEGAYSLSGGNKEWIKTGLLSFN